MQFLAADVILSLPVGLHYLMFGRAVHAIPTKNDSNESSTS